MIKSSFTSVSVSEFQFHVLPLGEEPKYIEASRKGDLVGIGNGRVPDLRQF